MSFASIKQINFRNPATSVSVLCLFLWTSCSIFLVHSLTNELNKIYDVLLCVFCLFSKHYPSQYVLFFFHFIKRATIAQFLFSHPNFQNKRNFFKGCGDFVISTYYTTFSRILFPPYFWVGWATKEIFVGDGGGQEWSSLPIPLLISWLSSLVWCSVWTCSHFPPQLLLYFFLLLGRCVFTFMVRLLGWEAIGRDIGAYVF